MKDYVWNVISLNMEQKLNNMTTLIEKIRVFIENKKGKFSVFIDINSKHYALAAFNTKEKAEIIKTGIMDILTTTYQISERDLTDFN